MEPRTRHVVEGPGEARTAGPAPALTGRAEALVRAQTHEADRIAAWIGLGLPVFLGLLYLLSPKAIDSMIAMQPITPVPAAVGLFLIVALARLWLVRAGPLSEAAVILFTAADFALLYGLIWSFHLQYEQPPAFVLKAPTFLFVFLLIALRALRLDPLAVLAAGGFAVVGWAALVAWVWSESPAGTVTRDFAAYVTGSRILFGAEIEKLVAVALFSLVLAAAIQRGRRQAVLAATQTTARQDLSRFFAPEIAARITSEDNLLQPGYGEVRAGAILMADIRGFTALAARRRPQEVMALLVAYQRRIAEAVGAHEGAIDKFLGDGVLVTFGCVRPSSRSCAQGLGALFALIESLDALAVEVEATMGEPIAFGLALTHGEVLCGTVGEVSRLEFTVIGDAVNLAAKLEKANKALGSRAIVCASTVAEARRQGAAVATTDALEAEAELAGGARIPVLWWPQTRSPAA
jgi:adenylate cyclase